MTSGTTQEPAKKPAAKKPPATKPAPTTMLELIEVSFAQPSHKSNVTRVRVTDYAREAALVAEQARQDTVLAGTLRLLLSVANVGSKGRDLRDRVLALTRIALSEHAAFALRDVVDPGSDAPGCDEVGRAARIHAAMAGMSDYQRERFATNAPTVVALHRALSQTWDFERTVQELSSVWRRPAMDEWSERRRAGVLAAGHDGDALAVLSMFFQERERNRGRALRSAESRADELARAAAAARAEAADLQSRLDAQTSLANELERELRDRTQQFSAEAAGRVADHSHHVSDYERLRTRIVRKLSAQADLLANGLHALRADRLSVTENFLERAVTALESELEELRREGEGA